MRIATKILIGTAAVGALVGIWACDTGLSCGSGTIEMNGQCVASQGTPGGSCGPGATFNPATSRCEIAICNGSTNCGICGANTSLEHNDAGVPTCVGMGGPDMIPCTMDIQCPTPEGTKFMICGRLVDTETSQLVQEDDTLTATVKISFYDALAFANDPTTAPQFSVNPDRCGRYRSLDDAHKGVVVPGTNFLAVGVDDVSPAFPGGNIILTGIGVGGVAGGKEAGVRTYLTKETTDQKWSQGMATSLATQGVYLGIFIDKNGLPHDGLYNGKLKPGVKVTSDGMINAANDFYFDDTDPLLRTTVGAGSVTGTNGSALYINGDLVEYSGSGPTGCTWPSTLAKTLAHTVFVQEREGTCQ